MLLIIALFANAIHADVIEYLKLKNRLDFLEIVLISKWVIIIFNIVFSVYLLLTMFNKQEEEKTKVKESKTSNKKEEKYKIKKQKKNQKNWIKNLKK